MRSADRWLTHGLHPTALRARKSATPRAFSELPGGGAHAAAAAIEIINDSTLRGLSFWLGTRIF